MKKNDFVFVFRPFLANIAEKYNDFHRPRIISEPITKENKSSLYTCCSLDEITGDKMICSLSILPQIDQLPNMFIYVSLQRNFLVRRFFRILKLNENNIVLILV